MKFFLILSLAFTSLLSHAQYDPVEQEILKIVDQQDSLSRAIFLDSTSLKDLKRTYAGNTREVWNSTHKTEKDIEMLFDIRLKFKSNEEAKAFHKKYLKANSEYGPEIKKHKIRFEGAQDFHVYKGTELVNGMVEQYGFQMFCYLFVVDTYFVKLYVTCNKEYKPEKMQYLITEIIKRVSNNGK